MGDVQVTETGGVGRRVVNAVLGCGLIGLLGSIVYPILRFVIPPPDSEATQTSVVAAKVGELAPIPAQELAAALDFTGWNVEMQTREGTVQCKCGYNGRPNITEKGHDYTIYHCPECKHQLPRIVDGDHVILREVTVKD